MAPRASTKLREAAAGVQWMCENARCLEQPAPEPPPPATAQPAAAETPPTAKTTTKN